MPEAIMTLQYEGDAVDAGTMDVRQLAPALIAAADAVREAHSLLSVPGPAPQVEVRATRPGSFIIDLLVAEPNLLQRAMELLNSSPVTATLDLSGLVGIVVASVGLVRRLNNRKITRTEEIRPGLIRLTLDDGTVIETPPESFQLVLDAGYRRSIRGMVEPLAGDRGVTSLTARTDDASETVTGNDLRAFEVPPAVEENLGESTSEVVLRPVAVSFAEGNKWRFHDGDSTFFAAIEDPRFAEAVELGTERFAKNDMLRVRLRTRQTRGADGLHTERTVVEVLDHLSGGVQLDLFADSDGSDGDTPK
jgi:hypothetical protein